MGIAEAWTYAGGDQCGQFFGTALRACNPPIADDARVLEIGCAEFDWLAQAHQSWPRMQLTGIDWRKRKDADRVPFTCVQGDVLTHHFEPASFDWIVSISAIEHVGLGHYNADPKHANGDTVAIKRAWHWLKPGGWLYFDVPWNAGANAYQVVGTGYRVYDDNAIWARLRWGRWHERWRGVVAKDRTTELVTDPAPLAGVDKQFYYIGFWWQKPLCEG